MKKAIIILFLVSLSSCFITEPTGYIDYRQRRMYDWDPIYYVPGYIDPFFYRRDAPIIIYRDRYIPVPRQPQQPRRNAFGPTAPPSAPRGPRTAPIRQFPKKDEKKDK